MNIQTGGLPVVLGITGASGSVYAARLLQTLLAQNIEVHLAVSSSGASVAKQELGVALKCELDSVKLLFEASNRLLLPGRQDAMHDAALQSIADGRLIVHGHSDYFTPIASGSFLTRGMVICPCSGSTLSGVAHSASQNLIQRAAEVHLKEHRKLILVPRETPLSVLQIENMHRLAQAGVVILPASPGWYHGVDSLLDLVDFVVARILDQLGIANDQIPRWGERSS